MSDHSGTEPPAGDDWLMPPSAEEHLAAGAAQPVSAAWRPRGPRGVATTGALLLVGAIAGALVVSAVTGQAATPSTATTQGTGRLPGGGQPGPGPDRDGGRRFAGGLDGEQHLQGRLTGVGASTITVRTAGGTHTYRVTAQTQVVRDGVETTLDRLQVGDPVLVHVYPSGGALLVERVFAGTLPRFGGPRSGGPPPGQPGSSST